MTMGGAPVGLLAVETHDWPWILCRFEPLDGWESVRHLFDVQNEAASEGFPAEKLWATKEILDRGVALRSMDAEGHPDVTPFMVYVKGGTARFRPGAPAH
ncbi:hypothetical protein ACFY0G_11080 [Streptomyces sp. NPDC001552]|uniref:hypothetical protein n=1 Tax=Streptomyces sp. NPDC001552 TaxID=3364587 RepID=UPI003695DF43